MSKRNFCTLPQKEQLKLRRQVVEAVLSGQTQGNAGAAIGVSRQTVCGWMKWHRKGGDSALHGKRRGRKEGQQMKLNIEQGETIKKLVSGNRPTDLDLPFMFWTHRALQTLIDRECGVFLPISTIGNYIKRWGLKARRYVRKDQK